MTELIKQEEQDSELNCSKSDKDLESDSERTLIDTLKSNDNNTSVCREKYDQYTSADRFIYVGSETFDTIYDGYIEFKNSIDDFLKSLNFGKEFDSQVSAETNNDVNSIKYLKEKINVLQNENKQLKDDNKTLSEIIKFIHENKCLTESKSIADDDTNKWEIVKSRRNKTNKNISDPESGGVMNKFHPFLLMKIERN